MPATRYRLKLATWTVVRQSGEPSPQDLSELTSIVALAKDIVATRDDDKEHLWAIYVNAEKHYQMHTEISFGTLMYTVVHPREVFGPGFREGASMIILVHNHPSGDPQPSENDIVLTKRLGRIGFLIDMPIRDHIIIGNGTGRWDSIVERGELFPLPPLFDERGGYIED